MMEEGGSAVIYGIGHDVMEIRRIERLLTGKRREAFLQRILTADERTFAQERTGRLIEFVTGRFAAKEAVAKAFGCGIGKLISFQDMTILPLPGGRPAVQLAMKAWEKLELPRSQPLQSHNERYRIHLTITHQTELASAFVVVERIFNEEGEGTET